MKKFDNLWIGAVLGIITIIIPVTFFYLSRYSYEPFSEYLNLLFGNKRLLSPMISLAGVPNLVLFFIFMKKDKYKTCRGLILATFVLVLFVVLIKIFL